MHIDDGKKFDVRNIASNIKGDVFSQKEYESYLSRLPDVSDKMFYPEADEAESTDQMEPKKKEEKKKTTGKRK